MCRCRYSLPHYCPVPAEKLREMEVQFLCFCLREARLALRRPITVPDGVPEYVVKVMRLQMENEVESYKWRLAKKGVVL